MDEKDLDFDRSRHLCYTPEMKAIIRSHLLQRCGPEELESLWEKIQLQYAAFLREQPELGGAKCTHNGGAGGTYDCIALFAFYEVLSPKPTIEELYEMNNAAFLPPFRRLGKFIDLNHPLLLRLLSGVFHRVAAKDRAWAHLPTSYLMSAQPYSGELGTRYRFDRCPIAEFAKAHGYLAIMPAFCNGDYPAMAALHGALIRESTCASGAFCDYRIVGDRSEAAKARPAVVDAEGYLRNPPVRDQ